MKEKVTAIIAIIILLLPIAAAAENDALLGKAQGGVKVDYIRFSDGDLKDFDVDNGTYVGLEAYWRVKKAARLYLGSEVGYAKVDSSVTDKSTGTAIKVNSEFKYIPVELNAKWLFDLGSNLNLAIGTGLSLNYIDAEASASATGLTILDSDHDWIFGGQGFFDINYTLGSLFVGIDAKYKLTEGFDGDGENYSNFTAGAHVGWTY